MGLGMCPCDGSLTPSDYASVVELVSKGMTRDASLLLDPLAERMVRRAREQRFEEAAALRDRYEALAMALRRRRAWSSLQAAGRIWAEDESGDSAFIDNGRLAAAWNSKQPPPLMQIHGPELVDPIQVPDSTILQEEALMLWRWLNKPTTRIVDSQRPLCPSMADIPELANTA